MNQCELSIPGKTFIAGEYLALLGEPALVLATEPKFRLKIRDTSRDECPFHPMSPAGLYWKKHFNFFSNYSFEFVDPYLIGGFGASSAQFAMLQAFYQIREVAFQESEKFFDWHVMLQEYREICKQELVPPSGADVVGAASGMLTWFHRNAGHLQAFAWPFMEHEFFVVHTGTKLATHEHLAAVRLEDVKGLAPLMTPIHEALKSVDFKKFIVSLKTWSEALNKNGFCAENTLNILSVLSTNDKILFAKGCGAMGADVLFVLCEKYYAEELRSDLQTLNLKVVADSNQISAGLQIKSFKDQDLEI